MSKREHNAGEVDERDPELIDPDVRFLLANERTLLAWVRTALALVAGGLALCTLGEHNALDVGFGVMAILLGGLMAGVGYARFRAADWAIRHNRLPKMGQAPMWQVAAVIGFVMVVAVVEMARFR